MPEQSKPHCCTLGCEDAPEWEIKWGDLPDEYTHACTDHVGLHLQTGTTNAVYQIP